MKKSIILLAILCLSSFVIKASNDHTPLLKRSPSSDSLNNSSTTNSSMPNISFTSTKLVIQNPSLQLPIEITLPPKTFFPCSHQDAHQIIDQQTKKIPLFYQKLIFDALTQDPQIPKK